MTQLSLTLTPASRRTDSAASKRAERKQNEGKRMSDAGMVLSMLCKTPNSTSKSLAEKYAIDRYLVAKRLPDLYRNGLVDRVEDPDTGEFRWQPTEKGKQAVGVKTC